MKKRKIDNKSFFIILAVAVVAIIGVKISIDYASSIDNSRDLHGFGLIGGSVEEGSETGTAYYVDADNGGGDGSDWANAYDQLPSSLERGATYYIADGTYPSYNFDDPENGDLYIKIKKATSYDHGTDSGWNSDYGDGKAVFNGGLTFSSSYWVFDGQKGGGPGSWKRGFGFEVVRDVPNNCGNNGNLITFGDNVGYINIMHSDIYGYFDNDQYPGLGYPDVKNLFPMTGLKGHNIHHITFSNNWLHNTMGASFHLINWENVNINNNLISDGRNTNTDPYGVCHDFHNAGFSFLGTNDDFTVSNNIFDNIAGTGVLDGVNQGESSNWKIFGNLFSRSATPINFYYSGNDLQIMNNMEFYNNVIVGIPDGYSIGGIKIENGNNNKAYNNIWYDNIANSFAINLGLNGLHDNNYFSRNRRVDPRNEWCDQDYCVYDKDADANEANDVVGQGNPFVDYAISAEMYEESDTDPVQADFHLAQGSAAIDAGKILASEFEVDPDGNIRGENGAWDIGVYESEFVDCSKEDIICVDDTPGETQEYATILGCYNAVGAGQTCLVYPGDYGNERIEIRKSGTVSNPITFKSQVKHGAKTNGFHIKGGDNIIIDGFEITGDLFAYPTAAISAVSADNAIVKNNYIHDIKGYSILFFKTGLFSDNVKILDNYLKNVEFGIEIFATNSLVEGNEIERLINYGNADSDYMRFFGQDLTIRRNYFHGTSGSEIGGSHTDCFQTFNRYEYQYAIDVVIEENICEDYYSQGLMAETQEYPEKMKNWVIRNNVFKDSDSWGLNIQGIQNVVAEHNTFYNIKLTVFKIATSKNGAQNTSGVLRNNIIINSGALYYLLQEEGLFDIYNNIRYNVGNSNYDPGEDINVDPKLNDPSGSPVGNDGIPFTNDDGYILKSTSPAIDAGVDSITFRDILGNSRPQGDGWDIGAYESYSSQVECTAGTEETRQCGTTDIGVCEYGSETRVCGSQGIWGGWGACIGAVEPSEEICDDLDNNCDEVVDEGCNLCPEGFISYWKFNEGSGDLASDECSNNDGVLKNMESSAWINSDISQGKMLDLDGNDDYIAIENKYYSGQGEIKELSVCALFKTSFAYSSYSSNWAFLDFDRSEYFNFFIHGDGRLGFSTTDSSGKIDDFYSGGTYNDGEWHFACAVYDGKDKKIYADGYLANTKTNAHSGLDLGKGAVVRYGFIGDGSEASSFNGGRNKQYYDGMIDEVRLYEDALTAELINALSSLYNVGCQPTGTPETICNGIDDDCDNQVDEDYQTYATTCGTGVCERQGQVTCVNGNEVDSCSEGTPTETPESSCSDGLDNDCDGSADSQDADCNIVCYSDLECGSDGYIGEVFCSNGDIYQKYRDYSCLDAGTPQARCSHTDSDKLKQDCSVNDIAEINTCTYNPDGNQYTVDYRPGFTSACSNGICTTGNPQFVHGCGRSACNAQCETDNDCSKKCITSICTCCTDSWCEQTKDNTYCVDEGGWLRSDWNCR